MPYLSSNQGDRRSLVAASLFLALNGCDAFYSVRGTVRDCRDQRPLPDVLVALRYPGEFGAWHTDETGAFKLSVNDPPGDETAELVAAAPGYRVARRTVHHSYEEKQDVCLEPEASSSQAEQSSAVPKEKE